jgi:hypothetical protein
MPKKRRGRSPSPEKTTLLHSVLQTFEQLSEPVQVLLIIGLFLLVAWIVSNPDLLHGIIKAFQLWFFINAALFDTR